MNVLQELLLYVLLGPFWLMAVAYFFAFGWHSGRVHALKQCLRTHYAKREG